MSNLIKSLNNLRSLRAISRDLSLEQLELILQKIETVVTEKRIAVEEETLREMEHKERIEKYKNLLAEDGIALEELAEVLNKPTVTTRKKRAPRPPKYKYINENGETETWTGQGRTPRVIQQALNNGHLLSEFEI